MRDQRQRGKVTVSTRAVIILATVMVLCTAAIITAIVVQSRATAEQNFQQCVAEAGGYAATSTDEKIAIRDLCDPYLN